MAIKDQTVGVIGAGSFGTAIAQLLAENTNVLLYSRRPDVADHINNRQPFKGIQLPPHVSATNSLSHITDQCRIIFPVVPSAHFRTTIQQLSAGLRPYHILIHGTKGLDSELFTNDATTTSQRQNIHTMSEVIRQESDVVLIGCLSGPNLAKEILEGQPAATVIASRFNEVIKSGREVLKSSRFQVFGTNDITGAELAGALKNTIALGSGLLKGWGLGYNVWALLLTRGLQEMIHFGKALGANVAPFLGVAGIGDLVATASSTQSRNFTVGYRIAKGESLSHIISDMEEPAEGIRTIQLIIKVANQYNIPAPITRTVHRILFEQLSIDRAVNYLINYPYSIDVDYL